MAKNKPCDVDELADRIVKLTTRQRPIGPDTPTTADFGVVVSRMLRDELPALWEWSSQESEIEKLKAEIERPPRSTIARRSDPRASGIAGDGLDDVSFLFEIKDDDWFLVFLAKRNGRGIHDF